MGQIRHLTVILTIVIAVVFISVVMAVGPECRVKYAGGNMGKVIFDGKFHADKGLTCLDCHPGLFQVEKIAEIKMADHFAGKNYCFACHNATKAFASAGNCVRCHVKE